MSAQSRQSFEYRPAPYKAVRILKEGNNYYYAWFCNYLIGQDKSMPIKNAFDVFGIDDASDIISITPVRCHYCLSSVSACYCQRTQKDCSTDFKINRRIVTKIILMLCQRGVVHSTPLSVSKKSLTFLHASKTPHFL